MSLLLFTSRFFSVSRSTARVFICLVKKKLGMITPRFQLSQDENFLFITIHAPFSRVSDADIYMASSDFRFHSNPYYLRLNLPGEIVENDDAKAHFDADTNEFKITCPKVVKGEHFQGLDMLTSLLQPKGKREIDTGIEVLDETDGDEDHGEEADFDWFVEQKLEPELSEETLTCSSGTVSCYGFGLKHSSVFSKLTEELHHVVDVKNPDTTSLAECRTQRLEQEKKEFNPEHYLGDFFQTDSIDPLISFKPVDTSKDGEWSEEESNLLKNFPHKDFLMDHDTVQSTYLGLVDILLAYCYDSRTTMSDPTVESAWTIAKISGTLSWLEVDAKNIYYYYYYACKTKQQNCWRNFRYFLPFGKWGSAFSGEVSASRSIAISNYPSKYLKTQWPFSRADENRC